MLVIGWGGNQFTPLLIAYREHTGFSQLDVDVFLGAYVVGLVPGLLGASALSDLWGRRPVTLAGLWASLTGSVVAGVRLEVQRIARPDELGGLTGVCYALAYVGFLLPALLALLRRWFSFASMLTVVAAVTLCCTLTCVSGWSRHLSPSTAEPH